MEDSSFEASQMESKVILFVCVCVCFVFFIITAACGTQMKHLLEEHGGGVLADQEVETEEVFWANCHRKQESPEIHR